MSTYGDRGNVLYLRHFLEQHNVNVEIVDHKCGEEIPKAEIYIFGGGQDAAQALVAADLQGSNGTTLRQYLSSSYCLAVCGGYQLLGKYYLQHDGSMLYGLDFLPIITVANPDRLVGPVVGWQTFNGRKRTVVGFENHSGRTYITDDSKPLLHLMQGGGNNSINQEEGIVYGKTIGTYLHGPILPRNPHLVFWWLRDLLPKQILKEPKLGIEKSSHRKFIELAMKK